jgi:hypothetical protein
VIGIFACHLKTLKINRMNLQLFKVIVFIGCCIAVLQCKPELKTNNNVITIDVESNLNNYDNNLQLSDIAIDVQYIPLETNSKCLLKDITYVDISKKYILIKAKESIFLFNRNGEFLHQIGAIGSGPFEYGLSGIPRIINDSVFVPTIIPKDNIYIYSVNGSPISRISVPGFFNPRYDNWQYSSPNFLLQVPNYSGNEKYKIIKVNHKGEIVSGYQNTSFFNAPSKNELGTLIHSNQFYTFNNCIFYKEILNDTLWQLTDLVLNPKYVFKRGRYGLPENFQKLTSNEYSEQTKNQISITRIFETVNYVFYKTVLFRNYPFDFHKIVIDDLGKRRVPYLVLGCYNKNTMETNFIKPTNPDQQIEPTGIPNDLDGGINMLPNNSSNDNLFFSWFDAYELKKYIASEAFKNSTPKYPEKKLQLEQLANSLNDNDNPVLMLVKLKE